MKLYSSLLTKNRTHIRMDYISPWPKELDEDKRQKMIKKLENKILFLDGKLEEFERQYRDLCIQEAAIIGRFPDDYPLKQREPLPPIMDKTGKQCITTVKTNNADRHRPTARH